MCKYVEDYTFSSLTWL